VDALIKPLDVRGGAFDLFIVIISFQPPLSAHNL